MHESGDNCLDLLRYGRYLLQAKPLGGDGELGDTYLMDAMSHEVVRVLEATGLWHGTRSVDRRDNVIIFGEYSFNSPGRPLRDSSVFRSEDGGRTWTTVLTQAPSLCRHFHTVAADLDEDGVWWASSGDSPQQCHVWRSGNDGVGWEEVTSSGPVQGVHNEGEGFARSAQRFTDLGFWGGELLWGTDDWLGRPEDFREGSVAHACRSGSRIVRATKGDPLELTIVGCVGNPVRSLVDVGAGFIALTQAKMPEFLPAQVCFISKSDPIAVYELHRIEHHGHKKTAFSFSRSSRRAVKGRFYSYRSATDVFPTGARVLRWDIEIL